MRLLMLAPPGAGKGTIGQRLADHYGVTHLSSGDLLREQIEAGTPLGLAVRAHVTAGDLVPDGLLIELLRPPCVAAAAAGGYLLDGFPRTLDQAKTANEIATELQIGLHAVVHLEAPADVLVTRLLERGRTSGRSDDTPDTIRHRIEVYAEQTEPLVDYYRERGILVDVDATPLPGDVTAAAIKAIDALVAGR
jgi:adenylate kinase